jgi:O-antigen/teichoic acid export membrane protein
MSVEDPGLGTPITAVSAATPSWLPPSRQIAGWALKIVNFAIVQGVVQLLAAIAGLIIVRRLPKSEYALFAIANSIQVAFIQLADLGVGIGLRSIGGGVWQDPRRLGELVRTAFDLRRQFAVGAALVCFPLLVWLLQHNGSNVVVTLGLSLAVAGSVVPALSTTIWSTSLLLHGRYRSVQRLELITSAMRVAMIASLAVSKINAVLAALVGTVTSVFQALFLRRNTYDIIARDGALNRSDRRELISLSLKSLPNTIFFCLQGQVTLLILTLTRNPVGIADLTALGRLALLFAVFAVMFANMLAPRFTRCQDPDRLGKLYYLLVGGTLLALGPVVIAATLFPAPFLWLLGEKYAGLKEECAWVVAAGCLTQIVTVLWSLNSSKAWITIQAKMYIPTILGVQAILALTLDLRQFHNVVMFTVYTAAAPVPLLLLDAIFGLKNARTNRSG